MSALPRGWVETKIGEVTIECTQRIPDAEEKFQYIDIASIDRNTKSIVNPQQLVGKDAPSRARKHVNAGDVLVSMTRPNLNAVALVPDILDGQIASTGFDVLRAPELDKRWLFYIVRTPSFVDKMSALVQGALYPAIKSKDVRGYQVPIAPLSEQKRIADKLDAVLARIDACSERLGRVPEILKRLRQDVLGAATSGKLTNDWRKSGIDEWQDVALSEVTERIHYGYNASAKPAAKGTRLLRITDIQKGKVDWDSVPGCKIEPRDIERFRLSRGHIVIARTGGTIGKSFLIGDISVEAVFASYLIRLIPSDRILPGYLYAFLDSPSYWSQLREMSRGAAQPNVNATALGELRFLLPPLLEQQEIVRRVDALFECANRLDSRYSIAHAQVERLTPALLTRAFRGKLVPQDPNDEHALILLERIRFTREKESEKRPKKITSEGKSMPAKLTPDTLKEIIRSLPSSDFTFDDLRRRVSADYETIKVHIFTLLSERPASVKQVFDKKAQSMRFERIKL